MLVTNDVSYAVTRFVSALGEIGYENLSYPNAGFAYVGGVWSAGCPPDAVGRQFDHAGIPPYRRHQLAVRLWLMADHAAAARVRRLLRRDQQLRTGPAEHAALRQCDADRRRGPPRWSPRRC
ncbi:MAG: hypothetical protein WDN04_06545 [Rhodospirillales bacterium]